MVALRRTGFFFSYVEGLIADGRKYIMGVPWGAEALRVEDVGHQFFGLRYWEFLFNILVTEEPELDDHFVVDGVVPPESEFMGDLSLHINATHFLVVTPRMVQLGMTCENWSEKT